MLRKTKRFRRRYRYRAERLRSGCTSGLSLTQVAALAARPSCSFACADPRLVRSLTTIRPSDAPGTTPRSRSTIGPRSRSMLGTTVHSHDNGELCLGCGRLLDRCWQSRSQSTYVCVLYLLFAASLVLYLFRWPRDRVEHITHGPFVHLLTYEVTMTVSPQTRN